MSDVAAVLLTTNEPTTGKSMQAIESQTLAPAQIVVIENVSPFHRALNEGARQVTAPFFVQVDADMILDAHCFRSLRDAMKPGVGMVVAELRDPMIGATVGVKMFRSACFANEGLSDTISADTDFLDSVTRHGWKVVYVGRGESTLGDHLPEYTPGYTYKKYFIEGGRLRYRGATGGLRWRMKRLEASRHDLSRLAIAALAQGFFRASDTDELFRDSSAEETGRAAEALLKRGGEPSAEALAAARADRIGEIFIGSVLAGLRTVANESLSPIATLEGLIAGGDSWRPTVAKLGFFHGLLSSATAEATLEEDSRTLRRFLTTAAHARAGAFRRIAGAARFHLDGFLGRRQWKW
jgi:hypothetical protein